MKFPGTVEKSCPAAVSPEIVVEKSLSVVEKLHFVQYNLFQPPDIWPVQRVPIRRTVFEEMYRPSFLNYCVK